MKTIHIFHKWVTLKEGVAVITRGSGPFERDEDSIITLQECSVCGKRKAYITDIYNKIEFVNPALIEATFKEAETR